MIKKLEDGIWIYRENLICREFGSYTIACEPIFGYVYKTLRDATNAISKLLDGTNKIEPCIIGEISYNEEAKCLEVQRKSY